MTALGSAATVSAFRVAPVNTFVHVPIVPHHLPSQGTAVVPGLLVNFGLAGTYTHVPTAPHFLSGGAKFISTSGSGGQAAPPPSAGQIWPRSGATIPASLQQGSVVSTFPSALRLVQLDDKPIGYYAFDDLVTTGLTTVSDLSGSTGRDGVGKGIGVGGSIGGMGRTSGWFPGGYDGGDATSTVVIPGGAFPATPSFTVEMLVKPLSFTSRGGLFARDDESTFRMFEFCCDSSGRLGGIVFSSNSTYNLNFSGAVGAWVNGLGYALIAMRCDVAASTMTFFSNGVVDRVVPLAGLQPQAGSAVVIIGASERTGVSNYYYKFAGLISHVAYYGSALSDAKLYLHAAVAGVT